MITTLVPIKLPRHIIRDDQIIYSHFDNWKIIYKDDEYIKIDCISFNKTTELSQNVDYNTISNNDNKHLELLPPPNWLLIKLQELSYVLIDHLLIYGFMSIKFCNWVINDNDNNIIVVQLDDINSECDVINYNVKIITMKCLSVIYPDRIYQIKVPI